LPSLSRSALIARGLAQVLATGPWEPEWLESRAKTWLGGSPRWIRPFLNRLIARFGPNRRPRIAELASAIQEDRGYQRALQRATLEPRWGTQLESTMWPERGAPRTWDVPVITNDRALANFLGLTCLELDWFADLQGRNRKWCEGPIQHYLYRWQSKRSGGTARLIEAPKETLRILQRKILDAILHPIPPHDTAHGFRAGRSIRTYAAPHVGRAVVLKMDLHHFFPTISRPRVEAVFRTAGYPEPVAKRLAGLCTNRVPIRVLADPRGALSGAVPQGWRDQKMFKVPHLPQGAPTSPALANLCAYRLDCRLAALAVKAGATYTRYADDLAFSGDISFGRKTERFAAHVAAAVLEEGWQVQFHKTRTMRQGVRQQVAGVVVNDRPNLARPEFDRLKATLHNCLKQGPQSQNRQSHPDFKAHLQGRIAHLASLNAERGARLQLLFSQITW